MINTRMNNLIETSADPVVILGIDHGFGNIKTAHACFRAGVTACNHDPTFRSNLQKVLRKYPKDQQEQIRLRLLEGHAAFMEVHTMRKINEEAYSERLHASYMRRSDVYGIGYRMLHSYILEQGELGSHMTPYKAMQALLQDILNGDVEIT